MHAVLTAVGELHSLTDWQVSEASEEAELVDFWQKGGRGDERMREKKKSGGGGRGDGWRGRRRRQQGRKLGKSADELQALDGGLPGRSFIPTGRFASLGPTSAAPNVFRAPRSESDSTEACRLG